jgi:NAD(P)-dependent dehydrogenase (short-subunit alcohol dehydrogenase family)
MEIPGTIGPVTRSTGRDRLPQIGTSFMSVDQDSVASAAFFDPAKALKNALVVIVGGTSGIGRAVAEQADRAGARVLVASRNRQKVDDTVALLSDSARGSVVDLTDDASVAAFFAQVGPIDHLVLPGSSVNIGSFRTLSLADARASMTSKFWGQYAAVKAAQLSPGASVVLFSGVASRKPGFGAPVLSAINAAVETLGKGLAIELAPVRVNVVTPGVIDTELWDVLPKESRSATLTSWTERQPVPRLGRPDEIAAVALMLMTNPFVTGTVVDVDGGALLT